MTESDFICSLCYSEAATVGCICHRDLKLIGSHCLATHISHSHISHYVIGLPLAFNLLSNPGDLAKYLSGTLNSRADTKSRNASMSKLSDEDLSSLTVQSISKPDSSNDLPLRIGESLVTDFQISLKNEIQLDRWHSGRYLYYTTEIHRNKLFKYDAVKNSIDCIEIQIGTTNLIPIEIRDVLLNFKAPGVYDFFKLNPATRRFHLLSSDTIIRNYSRFLYHEDCFYFFGRFINDIPFTNAERFNFATNRLEKLRNMKYARRDLTCLGVGNRIYLFNGPSKNIEVFNTETLRYEEIEFDNSETVEGIACPLKTVDKIYLITKSYVQIYDLQFTKLHQVPSLHNVKPIIIANYIVHQNKLYYTNGIFNIAKFDLSYSDTHTELRYSNHYNRRNLYIPYGSKSSVVIDLKYKTAKLIKVNSALNNPGSYCELPNGYLLLSYEDSWVLYNLALNSYEIYRYPLEHLDLTQDQQEFIPNCLIYHSNYAYGFADKCVLKFDLEHKSCSKVLDIWNSSWRYRPCCLSIGNQIYILGGYVAEIDMFDTNTNTYHTNILPLKSKHVIAKVIDDRIYVLYGNCYQIYNKNLELIQEGTSNCADKVISSLSAVGYYDYRIYFFNKSSGFMEYHDIRTHERGVEVIEFLILNDES